MEYTTHGALDALAGTEVHTILTGQEWALIYSAGETLIALRLDGQPVLDREQAAHLERALASMKSKAERTK